MTTAAAQGSPDLAGNFPRLLALLRTPLFANALYLWGNAAAVAIAGSAFWTLATRLYDAQDVGLGSAAISIVTLLAMFSHLGLGLGLIRFLPESGSQGPRLANVVFTSSAIVAAVLSIGFLAGLAFMVPSLDFLREQPLYGAAFISFVVAATLSLVQANAFLAIRRAKYILAQVLLVQLSRLAFLALMATFLGAFGILASGGVAMALGAVVGFALLARGLPSYRPGTVIDVRAASRLLPFSLANYLADGLLLAPGLILPLLVVSLLSSAEGAYFYMAWLLTSLVASVSTHLAMSLFAEGSRDPKALRVLSRNAVAGGLAAAIVATPILLLLGDKLLLVFGREYAAEGETALRIMAVAALPAALVNVYIGALRVMKRTGEMVVMAGAVAVTTVALSSALLPVMGLAGAGLAYSLGHGLGATMVLARVLAIGEGTLTQRIRLLCLVTPKRPRPSELARTT